MSLSRNNKNIIKQIETSTDSTCLHVACYYGHRDMIEILLDYDALRSIRNLRYNFTSYEETHADNIKELFRRRFRRVINLYKTYDNHTLVSKLIAEFIHYYLNEYLLNLSNATGNPEDRVTPEQIKTLEAYFKGVVEEKHFLTYFIKAYTLTNGFHKVLNKHLALYILDYFDESKIFLSTYRLVNCLAHIVTLLIYHSNLFQYEYRGLCYRGMRVTQYDLNQYKLNQHMATIEMRYTLNGNCTLQYSCLCQYSITQHATAIDIQTLSMTPDEKEILILPFTVFKVVAIKRNDLYNPTALISIEIELEECKDPNDNLNQLKNMKKTKQRSESTMIYSTPPSTTPNSRSPLPSITRTTSTSTPTLTTITVATTTSPTTSTTTSPVTTASIEYSFDSDQIA
ncbi:unnamed protein product [Didymodactylos carnosus]|uniref:NAD(P)(+)--arginine ADP-ribosyltransferase n=1 Tax=Didymodactylos carnosus TaxID=1234261 RepID=A0A814P0I7_9BILA|nr:unnamed protein product [Didymodactylos carnosus]CAF3862519.1 unnamed protein product [Didymodactylos carnosus]